MMTFTTGGELRQLGLLGIQMGAVDRFIIEVFPSLPPSLTSTIQFFFYKTGGVKV